jgi:hypothetical protein
LVDAQSPISTGDEPVMGGRTKRRFSAGVGGVGSRRCSPADQVFCFFAQMNIIGDYEVMQPVNDFLVRFMGCLGAKRWIADETFEHDCAERPPIALAAIPLLQEDFGCNVIRRSNGRVGLMSVQINEPPCERMNGGQDNAAPASGDSLSRLRSDLCLSSSS